MTEENIIIKNILGSPDSDDLESTEAQMNHIRSQQEPTLSSPMMMVEVLGESENH